MLNRRRFIQGAASILGLSGASALYGNSSAHIDWSNLVKKAEYAKNTPLRILYPKGCLANLKPIISAFEEMTGSTVVLKETGFATIANFMLKSHLMSDSDESFDIAIPATFSIPDLVEAGVLQSFNELMDKFEITHGDKSLYRLGDDYRGDTYGFQSSGDAYLLFLRKSWLQDPANQKRYQDTYGYTLEIPRSWEELDQQMAFFHQPDQKKYGGCLYRSKLYMHWEYWIRLHGQGSYPFGPSMEPLIDRPAAIAALDQMKTATTYLHPSSKANGPYENFAIFGEGNCYANLSWGGGQKYFHSAQSTIKDDLIVTQPPGLKIGNSGLPVSYFNWGWSYVLSSKSQNKDLAFLFTLLATHSEHSSEGVAQADGFFDPFISDHFSHSGIAEVYGQPYLRALKVGLENAIPDLYMAGQNQYFASLRSALHSSIYQHVPSKLSLQAVASKWKVTTEQQGKNTQVEQWLRLQSKYPDELKSMLKGS